MSDKIEELARQKRNEYVRTWRRNNKDKVREANHRYWIKKAAQEIEAKDAKESEG